MRKYTFVNPEELNTRTDIKRNKWGSFTCVYKNN